MSADHDHAHDHVRAHHHHYVKQRPRLLRFLLAASGGYLWRSLKKCVKILLGRPVYFDERGLFLW
jgi:hypothetical protein